MPLGARQCRENKQTRMKIRAIRQCQHTKAPAGQSEDRGVREWPSCSTGFADVSIDSIIFIKSNGRPDHDKVFLLIQVINSIKMY